MFSGAATSQSIPDEIQIATICEHMGWTFQEYMTQPTWLIQTVQIKLNEEAHENNKNRSKGTRP